MCASRGDARWEIAPPAAIGDDEVEIEIHIAGDSVNSSAPGMLETHAKPALASIYVDHGRARLSRIDSLARDHVRSETLPFLNIDTQGCEDRVLDGAVELLGRSEELQLELSFVPLYERQKRFYALVDRLRFSV